MVSRQFWELTKLEKCQHISISKAHSSAYLVSNLRKCDTIKSQAVDRLDFSSTFSDFQKEYEGGI